MTATPAQRAKATRTRKALASEILAVIEPEWIAYGARAWTTCTSTWTVDQAAALAEHFAPSADEDIDRGRRANGYIITTSARQIRTLILNRAS